MRKGKIRNGPAGFSGLDENDKILKGCNKPLRFLEKTLY